MTVKEQKNTAQNAQSPPKQFVSESRIAGITDMSVAWYQKDRWLHKGKLPGCPYLKFGRSVRYEVNAVLSWLDNSNDSTASLAEAG